MNSNEARTYSPRRPPTCQEVANGREHFVQFPDGSREKRMWVGDSLFPGEAEEAARYKNQYARGPSCKGSYVAGPPIDPLHAAAVWFIEPIEAPKLDALKPNQPVLRDPDPTFEAFARPGREWVRDTYYSQNVDGMNKELEARGKPFRFLKGPPKDASRTSDGSPMFVGLWRDTVTDKLSQTDQRKLIEAEFPDRGRAVAFCAAVKRAMGRDDPPIAYIPPASLGVKVDSADVAARYDAIMKGLMG
jgi:hypothetical protein